VVRSVNYPITRLSNHPIHGFPTGAIHRSSSKKLKIKTTLSCLAIRKAPVQKKLTITIDENVYAGLHQVVGRRRISRFIQNLVRPHVSRQHLDAAYKEMAADERREAEALTWAEATFRDVRDETR
jgi:predicted CopG family antitoxin